MGKAESRDENKKEENGNFLFDLAYIAQHVILFQLFRNLACYQF